MDQSEKAININLDSQRNVMLRLGLQLEMGVFAATICGLMGLAFGMNLDSSLEDVGNYDFKFLKRVLKTSLLFQSLSADERLYSETFFSIAIHSFLS